MTSLRLLPLAPVVLTLAACGDPIGAKTPGEGPSVDLCAGVTCPGATACRQVGTCDPATGTCLVPDKRDGTACDDGNACTYGDACVAGACVGQGTVVCRPLDDCHEAGVCDPASGCSNPTKADDTPCGDNNACTAGDRCVAGACVGTPVTCQAIDACHWAGVCNPGTGRCSTPAKPDGEVCDTGSTSRCITGSCVDGACVAAPVLCTPIDDCHDPGSCDPATGECSTPAKVDGSPCEDGDLCTENDNCQSGSCVTGTPVVCQALDQCHRPGVCDPASGCTNPPKDDGSSCDDGNGCTQTDVCVAGGCVGGNPKPCAPIDECHVTGVCNPVTGACTTPAIEDGAVCDDRNACTRSTTCTAGVCGGGTPVVCTALDQCHVAGVCDPTTGCPDPTAPDGTGCEDGNLCTLNDTCVDGGCTAGAAKICTPSGPCKTAGVCSPTTGLCSDPNRANGTPCSDGNPCTLADACQSGTCQGTVSVLCAETCLENDQYCDTSSGACVGTPVTDGTACDDDDPCTTTTDCQAGVCLASAAVDCTDTSGLTCRDDGFCDPASGECTTPTLYSGATCADGPCFLEVTGALGITWRNLGGTTLGLGAGAAFLDFDDDGWLDLLLAGEGGGLALYRNLDGSAFEDRTAAAGLPTTVVPDMAMGVAVADVENDGDSDIFLITSATNALYLNAGNGTFVDGTTAAGLILDTWSVAAGFADFDRDGDLDLYVGNYLNGAGDAGLANQLYVNDGSGRFTNLASSYHVATAAATLAVLWSDYDADGWPDLLVCNEERGPGFAAAMAFHNDGETATGPDDFFSDATATVPIDLANYCRGLAAADYDNDWDLDYYVSNLGENLLLAQTAGAFGNVAVAAGVAVDTDACLSRPIASFGAAFFDVDNDCALDLYVANGWIDDADLPVNSSAPPNSLLSQDGATHTFIDAGLSSGTGDPRQGRGVAVGDYDRDGDLDLLLVNRAGSPVLYRNVTSQSNGWAELEPRGRLSNRDGLGLRVEVAALGCGYLVEHSRSGFASSHAGLVHLGLGSATEATLGLTWPSGVAQQLLHVASGTRAEVVEPWATITDATGPALPVAEGEELVVDLSLANHRATATAVTVELTVRVNGAPAFSSLPANQSIPAAGSLSTAASVEVPVGGAAGGATAEVVVSVSDAGGGLDQTAVVVQLVP